jgi:hypothetical protein
MAMAVIACSADVGSPSRMTGGGAAGPAALMDAGEDPNGAGGHPAGGSGTAGDDSGVGAHRHAVMTQAQWLSPRSRGV